MIYHAYRSIFLFFLFFVFEYWSCGVRFFFQFNRHQNHHHHHHHDDDNLIYAFEMWSFLIYHCFYNEREREKKNENFIEKPPYHQYQMMMVICHFVISPVYIKPERKKNSNGHQTLAHTHTHTTRWSSHISFIFFRFFSLDDLRIKSSTASKYTTTITVNKQNTSTDNTHTHMKWNEMMNLHHEKRFGSERKKKKTIHMAIIINFFFIFGQKKKLWILSLWTNHHHQQKHRTWWKELLFTKKKKIFSVHITNAVKWWRIHTSTTTNSNGHNSHEFVIWFFFLSSNLFIYPSILCTFS